jgi:hypothetical protein
MAAALSATASRATVRVQVNSHKLAFANPCIIVRTFQRGRFSVVSGSSSNDLCRP